VIGGVGILGTPGSIEKLGNLVIGKLKIYATSVRSPKNHSILNFAIAESKLESGGECLTVDGKDAPVDNLSYLP
jgi:hypothetical protein